MVRKHALFIVAGLAALLAGAAQAQTVYRIVGPDGRVTFTDRAPQDQSKGSIVSGAGQTGVPLASDALPYVLRQAAMRYPVVLYTGSDCVPCNSGRNLLINRGIPFTERTVSRNEDVEALQRLAGDTSLPLLTVGNQQVKGYSDSEWSQYLDAAGYPRQSALPGNYQRPAPTPLAARTDTVMPSGVVPKPEPARPTLPAPAPTTGPTPSNPAGIIF